MKFGGGDGGMNLEKNAWGYVADDFVWYLNNWEKNLFNETECLVGEREINVIGLLKKKKKRISLTSGAGKIGQPLVKEWN